MGLWRRVNGEGSTICGRKSAQYDNKDTKKQDPCLRGGDRVGVRDGETFHLLSLQTSPTETLASAAAVSVQRWGESG